MNGPTIYAFEIDKRLLFTKDSGLKLLVAVDNADFAYGTATALVDSIKPFAGDDVNPLPVKLTGLEIFQRRWSGTWVPVVLRSSWVVVTPIP